MRGRRGAGVLLTGLALAGVYLLVAGLSFRGGLLPGVPVLDGLAPPAPYQWVKPPPDRRKDNKPPGRADGTVPLTSLGSAGSVTTPDGQAQVILDNTSVPPQPGQTAVRVTIDPLDPATVGSPPARLAYDSNAYRIALRYEPSNQPVGTLSAVVVLSYAIFADRVVHWNGASWDSLASTPAGQNQLFANVASAGTFAAAGVPTAAHAPRQPSPVLLVALVIVPFALIAAVLVAVLSRRRSGAARGGRGSRSR